MTMNISGINNLSNSFNKKSAKEESDKKFIIPNDPVAEGICKNVKDPIDREEDLRFWNQVKESGIKYCKSGNKEMTYSDFKELKEATVGFPPPSAPGRVRKAYREYMEKLPKDVRDEMQGILTFTYDEFIRRKGIKTSDWKQVLKIMNEHIGELGYPSTDFNFIKSCLNDFSDFDKESYKTVYNNATLNNSSNKSESQLSEDEINKEVDMLLYKHHKLDKLGIEFGSQEFEEWIVKNQDNFIIPIDAPVKLRKAVYDMLDSAKDPAKFYLLKEFTRGFRKVKNHSDLKSYMAVTENILKDKMDYLKLVRMNETDAPIIKKAIDDVTELVNEILAFRNKLNDIILDYEEKEK